MIRKSEIEKIKDTNLRNVALALLGTVRHRRRCTRATKHKILFACERRIEACADALMKVFVEECGPNVILDNFTRGIITWRISERDLRDLSMFESRPLL